MEQRADSFGPARRLEAVLSPVIPQVAALAACHPDCLSLAQGMVSWGPPETVAAAVRQALVSSGPDATLDRYGPVAGDPDLLAAVRQELAERRGLELSGSALLVCAGSNMAFQAIAAVLCDPGDEVILPLPWYFNHVMAIQLAGGVPVEVDAGFFCDPDRLAAAITPRTRAIVTVSPGNPSGVVLPCEHLAAINRLCARHGLFHISDEAYAAFVYGSRPHHSPGAAAGSSAHTVSLYSLSKAYGMAGWRVGYAALPAPLMEAVAKVQDTQLICPPRLIQRAAIAALEAGEAWCQPRIRALDLRRLALLESVVAARDRGLDLRLLVEPDGAFYGLLECASGVAGFALIERLVREHGVAALPGASFGLRPEPGRAILRLSYGMLEPERLQEALGRLFAGLEGLACR